ncbi:MAG: integrin alpha [Phycisphaera sp.]|nr:MAG: integrin alpha [Phycisphaera sp.]
MPYSTLRTRISPTTHTTQALVAAAGLALATGQTLAQGPLEEPFPAVLELADLDGGIGFVLTGAGAGRSGFSVAPVGDMNSDGMPDFAVAGRSYCAIVFGRDSNFPATVDLDALDGTDGFRLTGFPDQLRSQNTQAIAHAGDINGDGIDDVVVSAAYGWPLGRPQAGQSFVVFGRDAGFAADLDVTNLDGTNGFTVYGEVRTNLGWFAGSAGDLNGDGVDDLAFGAPGWPYGGAGFGTGKTYVIYGDTTGFPAVLDMATLDATTGFRINGIEMDDSSGWSVASAGDFNSDGVDDLLIGASRAGRSGHAYVVFGNAAGFPLDFPLTSLDGSNGFRMSSSATSGQTGHSVALAGDLNNDGVRDLLIGARYAFPDGRSFAGQTYVVHSQIGGYPASINLDTSSGSTIKGVSGADWSGSSVSPAGDLNGDGLADLLIGAPGGDPMGRFRAGQTYVVFGSVAGLPASLDLSSLAGPNGFTINGTTPGDESGQSVALIGDVNGDGRDDIMVGTDGAAPGRSYVIYGREGGCLADLDGDGELTVFDFVEFQNLFAAGSSEADFDGDGSLTVFDFLTYINAFNLGCP